MFKVGAVYVCYLVLSPPGYALKSFLIVSMIEISVGRAVYAI